jgi:hypothetical protein
MVQRGTYQPAPGLDDRAEAETLRAFEAHDGSMAAHPIIGPLSRDQWTRGPCIHSAHHLSFAPPSEG